MKKITLILGGIRSGKSCFAEQKALKYDDNPVYIATAIPFDDEMKHRVALHQQRRGQRFQLLEEPHDLTRPLSTLKHRTVLVDCLTVNLSNRLMAAMEDRGSEGTTLEHLVQTDDRYLEDLHQIIRDNHLNVILVSNEVGWAPVVPNRLGRWFQDLQGRWNRTLAALADEVHMVRAGLPTPIKKQPAYPFKLGAPSYVLPTNYIDNVNYLMDKVRDIQLLAFDSRKEDPLFKDDTVSTLKYLAKDSGITYSVHMPVSPKLFTPRDFDQRLETALYIIEHLRPLNISAHCFHFDLPDGRPWEKLQTDDIQHIETLYIDFFKALRAQHPDITLCLENTETPLSALDRTVNSAGISYCIDIGHLLVQHRDLDEIGPRLANTPLIHLHGWEESEGKRRDHRAVTHDPRVFKPLESFRGIVTIENYHRLLLKKSMELLEDYF